MRRRNEGNVEWWSGDGGGSNGGDGGGERVRLSMEERERKNVA